MSATTPEEVHELWTRAFQVSDLAALLALYEPNAVIVPSAHERLQGHHAIPGVLESFLALGPEFNMTIERVVQSGDLAVLFSSWNLVRTGAGGERVRMEGVTVDVVRRQHDGSWLMVIDNPFGGNAAFAAGSAARNANV